MYDFSAGVIATEIWPGHYEVFCNRCLNSIGTMRIDVVRQAVFGTLHRGGVLCPSCRTETCDACGLGYSQVDLKVVPGPKGKIRACQSCNKALARLERELSQEIERGEEIGSINWGKVFPLV